MNKELSCCFTGHRIISNYDKSVIIPRLERAVSALVEVEIDCFYAGGALGFDTIAAETVIKERETNPNIKLVLVLPCKNQAARWQPYQVQKYEYIKSLADKVIYTSDEYTSHCMHVRNRYLVDHSRYCICFLKKNSGGTLYTVNYAKQNDLIIYNVYRPETPTAF